MYSCLSRLLANQVSGKWALILLLPALPCSCWLFRPSPAVVSHWQLDHSQFWASEECRQTLSYAVVQHPRGTLKQWLQPRNRRVTAVAFRSKGLLRDCRDTSYWEEETKNLRDELERSWNLRWLSPRVQASRTALFYRTVFNDKNSSYLSAPILQLLGNLSLRHLQCHWVNDKLDL